MKALQLIINCVAENPSQPWALATLVQTEGSTYRKPGARLLVARNGRTLGVLSGGCLEEEIGRCGQDVIASGSPVLLSFDTRRLYGCDGRLKILIEPLLAAQRIGNSSAWEVATDSGKVRMLPYAQIKDETYRLYQQT